MSLFSEPTIDIPDQSTIFAEDKEEDQMTVQEKLRAIQIEADQAAAAMHAEDLQKADSSQLELELDDGNSKPRGPAKKSKIKGRPKRRKSTLSPEELENLLGL